MKVGFTGTQIGMTPKQITTFTKVIQVIAAGMPALNVDASLEFHHGDCIGADAVAHEIVSKLTSFEIVIHPPVDKKKRAFCTIGKYDTVLPVKPYIQRNHDIVNVSTILIATPKGFKEELRSGTWATIRYAKKKKVINLIIYPDGTTSATKIFGGV